MKRQTFLESYFKKKACHEEPEPGCSSKGHDNNPEPDDPEPQPDATVQRNSPEGKRSAAGRVGAMDEDHAQVDAAHLLQPTHDERFSVVDGAPSIPSTPLCLSPRSPPANMPPADAGEPSTYDTSVHLPPPQPAPSQPAWPQDQTQAGDRTDVPEMYQEPELRVRPAEDYLGTPEESYVMKSKPRGLALIINNIHFSQEHRNREGSEHDEQRLTSLLKQLSFDVQVRHDLSCKQLFDTIVTFAKDETHFKYDMAILIVLTHGGKNVLYGVDSRRVAVEKLIQCFANDKAKGLVGKPKWLVFQACRGQKYNRAVKGTDPPAVHATDGGRRQRQEAASRRLSKWGDIYLTFSSVPDYVSWRDLDHGSWLVQVLCKVFAESAHIRCLHELHLEIHRRMDTMKTSDDNRQTMETAQRGWQRKLYFNPGL